MLLLINIYNFYIYYRFNLSAHNKQQFEHQFYPGRQYKRYNIQNILILLNRILHLYLSKSLMKNSTINITAELILSNITNK